MADVPAKLLDREFARELTWSTLIEGFRVVENVMTDTRRWSIDNEMVVLDESTGLFWRTRYSVGATEMQDERPFEDADPKWEQVRGVTIEKVVYRPVV